jgi:hypothetical protein
MQGTTSGLPYVVHAPMAAAAPPLATGTPPSSQEEVRDLLFDAGRGPRPQVRRRLCRGHGFGACLLPHAAMRRVRTHARTKGHLGPAWTPS